MFVYYEDTANDVRIRIPKENYIGCIQYETPGEIKLPIDYLRALKNPYRTLRLRDMAQGKKKAVIVLSDHTRTVPARILLPPIMNELRQGGIDESRTVFIVACGVHRHSTREEIARMVGEDLADQVPIINHNAMDSNMLTFLGKTTRGTPVWVNKLFVESELRIALGQIEPHEFAGFTGGRKSVIPGISGEETIRFNHSPNMISHPFARPGILKGNPVHEDMLEAATMAGLDFIVNVVLNKDLRIIGIFAGDMIEAHLKGVDFVNSFSRIEIPILPDVVITNPGKPLDIDFYQSLKALIAVDAIASPETVVVLYSACEDGLGSTDMLKPFVGALTPEEVEANLRSNYKIQMDHAFLLARILKKGVKVIVCSPNVSPETIRDMMMIPAHSPQEAFDMALQISAKKKPKILVYPEAPRTLPLISLAK